MNVKKENNSLIPINKLNDIISNNIVNSFIDFLDVSPLTVKSYRTGIAQLLIYLNERGIKSPKREDILNFKNYLIQRGRKPGTVATYLAGIRRFFAWCESQGLYQNIAQGVKSPKLSHEHKKDAFSSEELKKIISGLDRTTLEGLRNFAIFSLITACGLRTVEVVRANIEDINRVAGVVILNIQGKGKVEKDAFVKLTEPVERAIYEYLRARGRTADTEPLFVSCSRRNKGGRLTTRTVSGICKSAMVRAGYNSKRLTAHSLRHSAVTIALLQGMSLQDVQAFARHSSMNTTLVYSHNINRLKSACENVISSAIF